MKFLAEDHHTDTSHRRRGGVSSRKPAPRRLGLGGPLDGGLSETQFPGLHLGHTLRLGSLGRYFHILFCAIRGFPDCFSSSGLSSFPDIGLKTKPYHQQK